jgi:hypothetical protein
MEVESRISRRYIARSLTSGTVVHYATSNTVRLGLWHSQASGGRPEEAANKNRVVFKFHCKGSLRVPSSCKLLEKGSERTYVVFPFTY